MKKPLISHTLESLHALCDEVGDCWEWTRSLSNGNQPQTRHEGKTVAVRKLAYLLAGGKCRPGFVLTPGCGNCRCINPACTRLRDKARYAAEQGKGRVLGLVARQKISALKRTGAKLTPELVAEIRTGEKSGRQWARETGISLKTIWNAKQGNTWQDYRSPFATLGARA